jgi:RimJ/RimL family protein N-acetyltransferase
VQFYTERLILREQVEDDATATHEYERDPTVARYMTWDVRTLEESRAYIRGVVAEQAKEPRLLFDLAVVRRDDGRLIGRAGLCVRDREQGSGELWYVLHPAAWGRGYAVEAVRALVGHGFGALGLHRIFADCDPRNVASVRVAERLGMRREAHFVENLWCKGEWCDTYIFALLRREWTAMASA